MSEAVILSACRTAIGTSRKGSLVSTTAYALAHAIVAESLSRTDADPADFDDIIFAEALYGGGVIARHAALEAGLTNTPGLALNRHCAGGLAAVQLAAANIRAGMESLILAGGVHSPSTEPVQRWKWPKEETYREPWRPITYTSRPEAPSEDVSITVGWNAAKLGNVSREEMDAWAVRSHQRAINAIDQGLFKKEIVPISIGNADGSTTMFSTDEHPRRNSSLEKMAALKVLHPEIPGFSITAGNASGVNDGAAALVVASDAYAALHNLRPLAVIRGWASVAVDPVKTGLTPTTAIPKALGRAGIRIEDVDVFEINEAFASMCVASTRILGLDEDAVNIHGSGCSLGHPIAATGARMLVTLLHELQRRGGGIGVAAMCASAGMGSALVLEVVPE
jgi:acetyl-CoA C-acetyltransferase